MTKRIIAVFVVLMMFTLMVGCSETGTTNSVASTDATSSSVTVSESVKEQPVSEPESVGASESQSETQGRPQRSGQMQLMRVKPGNWLEYYDDGDTVPVAEGDNFMTSIGGVYQYRIEINGKVFQGGDNVLDFMTEDENVLVMYVKEGEFLDEYSQTYKLVRAD